MGSCEFIPKVKDKKSGKEIEAPLYTEIKKITGPFAANNVFNNTVSEEAKMLENYSLFQLDEYGMPTIDSLLEYTDLPEYMDNMYYGSEIAKDLLGKVSIPFTKSKEILDTFNKIIGFNNTNKHFSAFLVKNTEDSKYEVIAVKKTKFSADYQNNIEIFVENANKVNEALTKAGFDEHFIAKIIADGYNVKYAKQLASSTFNPNKVLKIARDLSDGKIEGYVYNLLESDKFKDSPLVERLDNTLLDGANSYVYDFLLDNGMIDPEKVTREDVYNKSVYRNMARDYMLVLALSNAFSLKDKERNSGLYNIVQRLGASISKTLSNIDKNTLKDDDSKPVNDFNEEEKKNIVISFKSALSELNSLKSGNKKSDSAESVIINLIQAEKNRLSLAVRTGDSKEAGKIKKRVNWLTGVYEARTFNTAFLEFLTEQGEELTELYKKMVKSMEDKPLNNKTRDIRDLIQLCKYYENCIEYFNDYMNNSTSYKEDIKNELDDWYKQQNVTLDFDNLDMLREKMSKIEVVLSATTKTEDNAEEYTKLSNIKELLKNYIDLTENPIISNVTLSRFTQLTKTVMAEAQKNALTLTTEFLEQFQDEEARTIPWGDKKGETVSIRKELESMSKDINFYDLYLDAMADCPDMIMRLTDKAIKNTKNNIRLEVQELAREIKKEALLLQKSGVKDFNWMYKRNKDGKKTGTYITEKDEEFKSQVNSEAKRRFYDFFMKQKNIIDRYYPNNEGNSQIIGIRKDRLERLKRSKNIKDFGKQIIEGVKDNWLDREDDDDIAGYSEMFTDIAGNEVKLLPVHYNKVNEYNADDMSEDAVSTLIAYANKGIEYHNMVSLVNSIELEREVLKQRDMPVMDGQNKILNIINRKIYREDPSLVEANAVKTKDMGKSNVYKMFSEHIDMKLYGKKREKKGNIGKFSTAKAVDQLNKKAAISALSLNLLNGISNVTTGISQTRIESVCQQYFSVRDLAWADKTYTTELPKYLAEKGNRVKESKLALFLEQFDVLQEFDKDINETDWIKNTWFKRMINSEFMSVIQNAGEHYMNSRVALAVAHRIKLKASNGEEVNLYDALDIEYLQEDGTYGKNDKKLGARLKLKDNYKDTEGNTYQLDNKTVMKVTRKMAGINMSIHGIYNEQDKNLIQKTSIGRLIYMFRKWIPKSIDKRFANMKYNYDVADWTEGYYQTFFKFMYNLIKEHNGMKLEIGTRWKQLDERQKANVKRALTETTQFFALVLANNYMWLDDDKKDFGWFKNMLYYQSVRLQSELAALTPLSVIGSKDNMVTEALRIFKNPMAALSPTSDAVKLTQLLMPSTYTKILKSGPYKGHSKAWAIFVGNKFLFPYGVIPLKNMSPENYVGYYLQ